MAELIKFTEHLVKDGFAYAFGISAADLTGSGSLDLIAADTAVGLYWFENDGQGNFTYHVIHRRTDEWLERHAIADINGDGRPEIVIIDNINGSVLYFAFDGDPREADSWSFTYICEGGLPGAYDVAVADFDGDGDLDVAASSWIKGNQFVWFENRAGKWIKHLIEEHIAETRTICAVDFNKDGKMDLLGSASTAGQVMWYENPGDPVHAPWKKHLIDSGVRAVHGHPVDMDGDGDMDVVMALGQPPAQTIENLGHNQIVWYENPGDPAQSPWRKHTITADLPYGSEAVAADLDGDGQIEVVATGWGPDGRLLLFKHQGDPRGPWSMQVLKEHWSKADMVFTADLDGDGRLDIIAAAERGSNEVRWWQNEGAL
ncbi:MAG: VCBS repeat-containing protein [Chloroflexi bacterium]|nr:VCBS repeat-containing protein [Chloroflexota bacterium]